MTKPPGKKPLSKRRRQAELCPACRIVGNAFAEFLMTGEEATTDWQIAIKMVMRLAPRIPAADWQRFACEMSWPYSDIVADDLPAEPDRPAVERAPAKKLVLH